VRGRKFEGSWSGAASCGDEELVNTLRGTPERCGIVVRGRLRRLPIAEALSLGVPVIARRPFRVSRNLRAPHVPETPPTLEGRRWLTLIEDFRAAPDSVARADNRANCRLSSHHWVQTLRKASTACRRAELADPLQPFPQTPASPATYI